MGSSFKSDTFLVPSRRNRNGNKRIKANIVLAASLPFSNAPDTPHSATTSSDLSLLRRLRRVEVVGKRAIEVDPLQPCRSGVGSLLVSVPASNPLRLGARLGETRLQSNPAYLLRVCHSSKSVGQYGSFVKWTLTRKAGMPSIMRKK
jgi:hypothetical protein